MKAGFVAICGSPNVGKSTLLNALVGVKLSIVSPKVQTTRTNIKGILNNDDTQLIFVDTPGIFSPKRVLEEAIVNTAWHGLDGIDIVLLVIDAIKGICSNSEMIIRKLHENNVSPIVVINKTDAVTKEKLSRLVAQFPSRKIFTISAIKNQGLSELVSYLSDNALEVSQWYFPEDQLTTSSLRVLASEITREKLFLNLSDELPYNLTVETESWDVCKNKSIKINQSIFVSRDSYKQIILGKRGEMIKKIGILARKEIEELVRQKVHLMLFVKVRENWLNDAERYKYLDMQGFKRKKGHVTGGKTKCLYS
jgi:GTPase